MKHLRKWLTLSDYDEAKRNVSRSIVKKQTRRNVSAQNGAFMSQSNLRERSLAADADMRHLKDLLEAAQ